MPETFLFVGGPLDGERRETDPAYPFVTVAVLADNPTMLFAESSRHARPFDPIPPVKQFSYAPARFRTGNDIHTIYVPQDMKPDEAMRLLIANYRPEKQSP